MRTVADGYAVRRTHTAEAPALHGALESLALRMAGDVDLLARDKMLGRNGCTDGKKAFFAFEPELGDLHLQADFRLREMLALRLVYVLLLRHARSDLEGEVAIPLGEGEGCPSTWPTSISACRSPNS